MKVEREPTPLVLRARPRPGAPRPARRDADHRRLERAADADLRTAGAGARRRATPRCIKPSEMSRRPRRPLHRRAGAAVPRHERRRGGRGRRARDHRPARRSTGTSSSSPAARRRQDHPPGGGQAPDADRARARRQEPDHRALVGGHRSRPPAASPTAATSTPARSAPRPTTCWSGPRSRTSWSSTSMQGDQGLLRRRPEDRAPTTAASSTAGTERLAGLLGSGTAVVGGETDLDDCYIAPTVLVDVGARHADHEGRGLRADPAGPRDRIRRGRHRLGERATRTRSASTSSPRTTTSSSRSSTPPNSGDAVRERLLAPPARARAAVRRRRQLRHGQVPRPLGLRVVHQRPRRPLPQRPQSTPASATRRTPSTAERKIVDKLM